MPTRRLYYEQPRAFAAEAIVSRIEAIGPDESELWLDATPFYPEGGGQPGDDGTIAGFAVLSTTERDGEVVHRVAASATRIPLEGSVVACAVSREGREDRTVQHSAQHLLSSVALRLLGATTLSFHLGAEYSSIDLDVPPPGDEELDELEDEVRSVVREDYRVITHLCPPEDASSFPLRKEPTVQPGTLRIVEIDGLDYSACCGTHVRSTAEIGSFRLTKAERYKGGCRLRFVAGGRAEADHRRLAKIAAAAASAAGAAEDEVPALVAALKEKAASLEKALAASVDRVAELAAADLDASSHGPVVCAAEDSMPVAAAIARALARRGRVCLVSCARELKAVAASPAKGGLDVASVYGPVAKTHGGKGGGSQSYFQAAFPDSASFQSFVSVASQGTERQYR